MSAKANRILHNIRAKGGGGGNCLLHLTDRLVWGDVPFLLCVFNDNIIFLFLFGFFWFFCSRL